MEERAYGSVDVDLETLNPERRDEGLSGQTINEKEVEGECYVPCYSGWQLIESTCRLRRNG